MTTATRTSIQGAADILGELAGPIPKNGKPSLPVPMATSFESGKPGLPELEPEGRIEDEEDLDYSNSKKVVEFSQVDRADLHLLERRVEGKLREAAEAIREIRQRQLWRQLQSEDGKQLYGNFDDYCQDRLGHTRQWVTHLTNWLRIIEELERLKCPIRNLTVKAAQGLLDYKLEAAGGLRVVLEEATEAGVPLDRESLREIVERRARFNTQGEKKPAAVSYAEYKNDLALVKELGDGRRSWGIVKESKSLDGDLSDNLVAACKNGRTLPDNDDLLTEFTGEALESVVTRLKQVAKESAEIEEKKKALAERRREIRERQQDGGLKKLKEEAKSLKEELQAQGVLSARKPPVPPTNQGGTRFSQPDDDDEQIEDQPEDSEVYTSLHTVWEILNEVVAGEWPQEDSELNAIFLKAQDCETKLAEITVKVKELMADAEQPLVVQSGDQ